MSKESTVYASEDQAVLLLYAFAALPWAGVSTAFLTGFLYTIIYMTVNGSAGRRICSLISTAVYLAAAFFCRPILYFSPAVLYTFLRYRNYAGILPLLALIFRLLIQDPAPAFLLFLVPGYTLAGFLYSKTTAYESLDRQHRQTRDDSTERNLLLKEKNLALQKNQNYEIYTATLKERNRIAREIHDHVGHMLSRSILLTAAIRTMNRDASVEQPLGHLENTLHTAMENIRSSVHNLHDESINLKDVLESLASSHTSCPVVLDYDMGYEIPGDVKYCLIAIVKEALHNIARHSNAGQARIILREHPGLYQLSVEDNGTAIDRNGHTGMGLRNMQERARTLGGNMQIYTGQGFRIFVTLPKSAPASETR